MSVGARRREEAFDLELEGGPQWIEKKQQAIPGRGPRAVTEHRGTANVRWDPPGPI